MQEADRVRDREAKRLCQEVATQDMSEKYQKVVVDNSSLQERINSLEEAAKEHLAVQTAMKKYVYFKLRNNAIRVYVSLCALASNSQS